MTFLELAEQIDTATKAVQEAEAVANEVKIRLNTVSLDLSDKRTALNKLTSQMKGMLGVSETQVNEDTASLKQLALDGQKFRTRL